jgi:anti-sigma B factor antagonist
MRFAVEHSGDASVVSVKQAKLTYPVLAPFFAEVRAIAEDGARTLVIDLEAVSYIDSAAIGCLVEIHRLLEDLGGTVRLSGLQRRVETMLSMTGVLQFLNVEGRASSPADPWYRRGGLVPHDRVLVTQPTA